MPDVYGALPLPSVASDPAEAAGDPALEAFGAFLTAVLNADVNSAWQAVAPNSDVVVFYDTNDPTDGSFSDQHLPGLFLWRQSITSERIADDYETEKSTVIVQWVPRPDDQFRTGIRSPIINAICKAIDRALWYGRHPAWVVEGDDDPDAATLGSSIMKQAGLFREPGVTRAEAFKLPIQLLDGPPRTYQAVRVFLQIDELLEFDVAARFGSGPARLQLTMTDATGQQNGQVIRLGAFSNGFDRGFDAAPSLKAFSDGFTSGFS